MFVIFLYQSRREKETEQDIVYPISIVPQTIDLIILILSHPRNFEKRNSQRNTWIQDLPSTIIYRFVCGNPDLIDWTREDQLKFENEMLLGDVLIFYESIESYRGISKKVLLGLEYAVHLRSTMDNVPVMPRFIAKTDDDIYVAVKNVEALISRSKPTEFYAGKVKSKHYAHREENSHWYTSYEEWPSDIQPYPDFACGAFYIMSSDAAIKIAKLFRKPDFKIFPYEDVQGGILMERIGIQPTHINVVETGEPGNDMIANHYGGVQTMWKFHRQFGKTFK
jgi:hypothetical protein